MKVIAAVVGLAALLASCSANRSPEDVRKMVAPRQFQFNQPPAAVRNCILPLLDKLEPFNIQPGLTRPVTVRDLGEKIEIFSQDETITLYTIDLVKTTRDTSTATAYAPNSNVLSQIDATMRRCGGT
jgi:hypothetical protein